MCMCEVTCIWKLKDNFWEWVLFLLPRWSKNQTQILKLGGKHLFDEPCGQFILPLCFVLFLFFETGFLCVTAPDVLELALVD